MVGVQPGKYDIATLAAHESGHSFGLDHSTASPSDSDPASLERLTMYPFIAPNRVDRRLGRGDVRDMRCLYPTDATPCFR